MTSKSKLLKKLDAACEKKNLLGRRFGKGRPPGPSAKRRRMHGLGYLDVEEFSSGFTGA